MSILPGVFIVAGLLAALIGLYLLAGLAWVLVIGGLVMFACGVAADVRWG